MSPAASPLLARRRWLMWGIPAAIFFIAFIHRVVPGIVAKDLMQAFGATGAIRPSACPAAAAAPTSQASPSASS